MSAIKQELLHLQPRDHLLFQRLCEMGYLTRPQIANEILQTSLDYTSRRLNKLIRASYLSLNFAHNPDSTKIFVPVPHSVDDLVTLEARIACKIALNRTKKIWERRNSICHDFLVRDWALKLLRNSKNLSFSLDLSLKDSEWGYFASNSDFTKVPDFVLTSRTGKMVGFEVERSAKSSELYKKIFSKALTWMNRSLVYFCEDEATKMSVKRQSDICEMAFKSQGRKATTTIKIATFSDFKTDNDIQSLLKELFGTEVDILGGSTSAIANDIQSESKNLKLISDKRALLVPHP